MLPYLFDVLLRLGVVPKCNSAILTSKAVGSCLTQALILVGRALTPFFHSLKMRLHLIVQGPLILVLFDQSPCSLVGGWCWKLQSESESEADPKLDLAVTNKRGFTKANCNWQSNSICFNKKLPFQNKNSENVLFFHNKEKRVRKTIWRNQLTTQIRIKRRWIGFSGPKERGALFPRQTSVYPKCLCKQTPQQCRVLKGAR